MHLVHILLQIFPFFYQEALEEIFLSHRLIFVLTLMEEDLDQENIYNHVHLLLILSLIHISEPTRR